MVKRGMGRTEEREGIGTDLGGGVGGEGKELRRQQGISQS